MNTNNTSQKKNPIKKYAPLAIIVAIMVIAYATGAHKYISIENLAENRSSLNQWISNNFVIASILLILIYAISTAASLPLGAILTVSAGFLFGALLGGSLVVVGATAGATAVFIAAKTSFGDTLAAKAGPLIEKLRSGFQDGEVSYLLFLRLVPAFPFWLVNLAPALLGVKLVNYVWTTAIGIIPGTFAFAIFGSGLGSIIDAQKETRDLCIAQKGNASLCPYEIDYGAVLTPQLIGGLVALGVVALIPIVYKKLKARKQS